jgi:hypothetical protein
MSLSHDELRERVSRLRGEGKSPKQIARALGVAPSVVAPLVRAVAAEAKAAEGAPALVGCWVNAGWSAGLGVDPSRGWVDVDEASVAGSLGGLVAVLVARRHRHDRVSVCGYLVDAYCLGVKNALGPMVMTDVELSGFRSDYFDGFASGWRDAPVELAADLVFGGVEYARGLGFEPHPDLAPAAGHLGPWQPPAAITFGRDGKPFYMSGPYDNPSKIMKTLQRNLGSSEAFDFMMDAASR